ncbi:hypothetical protein EYF80_027984 [Liparis tanakae]|uniref:Uncharacterized protein n=1 Tax=Liparis tanakae TaxID=230148 RepID=A0A4Z2HAF3_9TELE|nr:hypothetical protein EYF80_027984 [Liparis tanakae]
MSTSTLISCGPRSCCTSISSPVCRSERCMTKMPREFPPTMPKRRLSGPVRPGAAAVAMRKSVAGVCMLETTPVPVQVPLSRQTRVAEPTRWKPWEQAKGKCHQQTRHERTHIRMLHGTF